MSEEEEAISVGRRAILGTLAGVGIAGATANGSAETSSMEEQGIRHYIGTLDERPDPGHGGILWEVQDTGTEEHGSIYYDTGSEWEGPLNRQYGTLETDETYTRHRLNETYYVRSANEVNEAFDQMREEGVGGRVRWVPGKYGGDAFQEYVEFPEQVGDEREESRITVDLRDVNIELSTGDYRAEDTSAYWYKPPRQENSYPVDILGGRFAVSAGIWHPTEHDYDDAPNGFELWNVRNCEINPEIIGRGLDRLLSFRQVPDTDSGHNTDTQGLRTWGGRVALQIGHPEDGSATKDRGTYGGQIEGFFEKGVWIGSGLKNEITAQVERPNDDATVPDPVCYRVDGPTNTVKMNHGIGDDGVVFDVRGQANGIQTPGISSFDNSNLGLRPSNIRTPQHQSTEWDFEAHDMREVLETIEDGDAGVTYNGKIGAIALRGSEGDAAGVASHGPVGHMDNHIHLYADMFVPSADDDVRAYIEAFVDEDNYLRAGWHAPTQSMVMRGVEGGETVFEEDFGGFPQERPERWILTARDGFQAFLQRTNLRTEPFLKKNLNWPSEPKFRIINEGEDEVYVRRGEHGYVQRWPSQYSPAGGEW